jgi:hypothetical protein
MRIAGPLDEDTIETVHQAALFMELRNGWRYGPRPEAEPVWNLRLSASPPWESTGARRVPSVNL